MNLGYELVCGRCIKYSFKTTYETKSDNEYITLINELPNNIIEMTVDGKNEQPSQNFKFPFSGRHIVYMLINMTNKNSLNGMFEGNRMTSIYFNSNFNTENIEDMGSMFLGCNLLTSINFTAFNTQKVKNMEGIFHDCSSLIFIDFSYLNLENLESTYKFCYYCTSLTSANFSNTKTLNLKYMSGMFDNCISLTSINLSSFNTQNVINMGSIFDNCQNLTFIDISSFICDEDCSISINDNIPNYGTIKVKNDFYSKIQEYIPETWNKIIID